MKEGYFVKIAKNKRFFIKSMALWAPLKIHFVCGLIGVAMVVAGFSSSLLSCSKTISDTLIALGISVLAGVLINTITTLKKEKDLNWHAFERAFYESITTKDRIRHSQRIELCFDVKNDNDNKLMSLNIKHSFDFCNMTKIRQDYRLIKLFNDYHPPNCADFNQNFSCTLVVGDKKVPLKSPDSKDGKIIIETEDSRDAFITLLPNETKHIHYDINNVYSMNDRLIWSFQEISDGAVIAFDVEKMANSDAVVGQYFLTILHPEAEEIKERNLKNNFLNENGELCFNTRATDGNLAPFEIKINNMILPYQGFEIKWRFLESQ